MSAAPNIFWRVRVTSPAPREAPVMVPVDCPATYDADPLRAARLADELTWALARLEFACMRARQEDSALAWWWVASWASLARHRENEWRISTGELPSADGEPS